MPSVGVLRPQNSTGSLLEKHRSLYTRTILAPQFWDSISAMSDMFRLTCIQNLVDFGGNESNLRLVGFQAEPSQSLGLHPRLEVNDISINHQHWNHSPPIFNHSTGGARKAT